MIVLGIDTSCDDTGVGIVEDGYRILSNVIASQHRFHERYGGIVPSVASRQHARVFNPILAQALETAGLGFDQIDAVAVTSDQGLALSLTVGVAGAKAIALAADKPLIGIHHVEGHIYSAVMANQGELDFPFLCLTVAGGHTMLILARAFGEYELLGFTRDDSAGEAYDKIARRLGLEYPGGPVIDRLATEGNPSAFKFPRPMLTPGNLEFSFSGLKTAVNLTIEKLEQTGEPLPVADLAASFQQAVVDVLVAKTLVAAEQTDTRRLALAGGVAANSQLRSALKAVEANGDLQVYLPPMSLCVDNGAMIAGAAYHRLVRGEVSTLLLDSRANAPLGSLGVKYRAPGKYRRSQL
jgi:N6-L-threonylcarbamoyladenine synthase